MDLNTWVSLATIVVCAIALFTYFDKKFDQIDKRFGAVDAKIDATREDLIGRIDTTRDQLIGRIDTTRDELKTEFKTDISNLTTVVLRLDERVYDLATGNRARALIVPPR